ncbi:MAG: glycosyltransferase family 1 protein [Ruminococcus sp.]|nr:glycosyltransferase family 1 protein [Ruminococcus sp.]
MIKVLVIETTTYGYDGISSVVKNYYKHLDHSQICMDLVTRNIVDDELLTLLSENGNSDFVIANRNRNPVRYLKKLVKIIRDGQYSIIHVHGCSATMAIEMLAGKIAGTQIRIAHSHNTKCDYVWFNRFLRPFFNRWCNCRFACGQEAGKWLFHEKEFHVVANGVDLEKFKYNGDEKARLKAEHHLDGKFVVGHIGRFNEQKNHQKLIEIYAKMKERMPNSVLVLVGDGELREKIESMAKELQLNVLFAGTTDHPEEWLQMMDVMIFPSLFEGLPLGLVEAQATALPCVLSDTISPMAQLTDIVKFEKLDASSEKWAQDAFSLSLEYDRSRYSDTATEMVRNAHFDIRANCDDLAKLYKKLLEKNT